METNKPWINYKSSIHKIYICKHCFYGKNHTTKRTLNDLGRWEVHHTCKCKWELYRVTDIYWCNKFTNQQLSLF